MRVKVVDPVPEYKHFSPKGFSFQLVWTEEVVPPQQTVDSFFPERTAVKKQTLEQPSVGPCVIKAARYYKSL